MTRLRAPFARACAIHDRLTTFGLALAAIAIGLLTLTFCGEVVSRYAFSRPTSWSQDLAGYLLVVSVFLAAPHAARNNAHVSVSFVAERLQGTGALLMGTATQLLAMLACFLSSAVAASAALKAARDTVLTQASLSIPQWWLHALVSYGLASSGLYFLRGLTRADGNGSHA